MKRENLKKAILQIIGAGLAGLTYLGYYPMGIAYFTGAYMEKVMRFLLFPVMAVAMSFFMPVVELVKYGLVMIVVMVFTGLLEANRKAVPKWIGSLIAGFGIVLMEVSRYLLTASGGEQRLVMGVLEGVLVICLSEISRRFISFVLKQEYKLEERNPEEEWDYHEKSRQRMEGIAEAFQNLANTFSNVSSYKSGYPPTTYYHSGGLSPGDYPLGEEAVLDARSLENGIERLNLMWHNRLMENRIAVAGQLSEMAQIMNGVAENTYGVHDISALLESEIKRKLREMHVAVKNITVLERQDKHIEIYAVMKSGRNKCILTKDIAQAISKMCNKTLVPSRETKTVIYKDYTKVLLEEDANFKVLYGVARKTKTGESISGDNFSFTDVGNRKMVVSLSDGMGSGFQACKESESVIELIEQFLEAGFCKETAVRMINSTMMMNSPDQIYATIDISDIDLYSGVCEFLKIGASATFIKRDNWVETIQSTSLPIGVLHQADIDTTAKKLYDGDFIIMVSDGAVDGLKELGQEELLREIILNADTSNPKEMAPYIMEKILEYGDGQVKDDMTVLAVGIWKA